MFLPVDSISEEFQPNSSPCKELIREDVVSNCSSPWISDVIDIVAPSYKLILETNSLSLSGVVPRDPKVFSKWWFGRMMLDDRLNNLLGAMNDKWIGPWECLLLGERLDAKSLKFFSKKPSNNLNSQCDFILNDNLIKVILSGAQSVLAAEACIVQSLFYKGFFGWGGCCGEQRFRAFVDHSKRVMPVLTSVESLISEAVGGGVKVNRQPIILVLDSDVQAKTTSPKRYCVRPNTGVIMPRSTCDFTVTMQAQRTAPPDMELKDKFLVQSIVVPFGSTDEDITTTIFSKESGSFIEEFKLRVILAKEVKDLKSKITVLESKLSEAESAEDLKSKMNTLQSKLAEAEMMIATLREEKAGGIRDRDLS